MWLYIRDFIFLSFLHTRKTTLCIQEFNYMWANCECYFIARDKGVKECLIFSEFLACCVPGHTPEMSSRNREYRTGWILKPSMAALSNFLRYRLAVTGAYLRPMATPQICRKNHPSNSKSLLYRVRAKRRRMAPDGLEGFGFSMKASWTDRRMRSRYILA